MFLEMEFLNFLPASHDSGSSPESNIPPHPIEILVVDNTNIVRLTRESSELIALKVVVVVSHCIGEATNDGLYSLAVWIWNSR